MSATFAYHPGSDSLCFASSSSGITNWNFVLLPKGTSTTITGNKYFKYIYNREGISGEVAKVAQFCSVQPTAPKATRQSKNLMFSQFGCFCKSLILLLLFTNSL